ncbi:DJ-1/PfpI family protein [Trinickia symbiotica]|nr:DJ-1/PfpI family protein [Trinickia symbiotica]
MIECVRHFAQSGKPIAAVCHGAQLLAAADVIRGRKISAYPACAPEVRLAGAEYVALDWPESITDGSFVTAPAWTSHAKWLRQFLDLLGTRIAL